MAYKRFVECGVECVWSISEATSEATSESTSEAKMQYPLINLGRRVAYFVQTDGERHTFTLSEEEVEFYSSQIDHVEQTWIFAFDGLLGSTFTIENGRTVANFINRWNFSAIGHGHHTLAVYIDFSYRITVINTCPIVVHLWGGDKYKGSWAPGEMRVFTMAEFFSSSFGPSPIMVMTTTPLFDVSAQLFRKRDAGFYTKTEVLSIPPGFYRDLESFVAMLNLSVSMRGERNGYIYNFFIRRTRKGESFIGVEASHRQPEPSSIVIRPSVAAEALGLLEEINLPLRTNRRTVFERSIEGGFIL